MDEDKKPELPDNLPTEEDVYTPQPRLPEQPVENVSKHSSKKKLALIVALFVLLIGGAAAYLLSKDKGAPAAQQPAGEQQAQTEQSQAFQPRFFFTNKEGLQSLDQDNKVKLFSKLEANEEVVAARMLDGEPTLYYYTFEMKDEYVKRVKTYGQITKDGKKKLFDVQANASPYYSGFDMLSPDNKNIFLEIEDDNVMPVEFGTLDITTGTYTKVLDGTEKPLMFTIGWLDNDTVLMQAQSCRQCDGPPKAELHTINIETGEIKQFFKHSDDRVVNYAGFQFTPDNKRLFMVGGDFGAIFAGSPSDPVTPTHVYEINLMDGTETYMTSLDQRTVSLIGLSSDGSKLYFNTSDLVKTDDKNAPYQSTEGNYNNGVPSIVSVSTSGNYAKAKLAIESSSIVPNAGFSEFISDTSLSVFTIVSNKTDGQTTTYTSKVFGLPAGENQDLINFSEVVTDQQGYNKLPEIFYAY